MTGRLFTASDKLNFKDIPVKSFFIYTGDVGNSLVTPYFKVSEHAAFCYKSGYSYIKEHFCGEYYLVEPRMPIEWKLK